MLVLKLDLSLLTLLVSWFRCSLRAVLLLISTGKVFSVAFGALFPAASFKKLVIVLMVPVLLSRTLAVGGVPPSF
jgi:hypothetical protein